MAIHNTSWVITTQSYRMGIYTLDEVKCLWISWLLVIHENVKCSITSLHKVHITISEDPQKYKLTISLCFGYP